MDFIFSAISNNSACCSYICHVAIDKWQVLTKRSVFWEARNASFESIHVAKVLPGFDPKVKLTPERFLSLHLWAAVKLCQMDTVCTHT